MAHKTGYKTPVTRSVPKNLRGTKKGHEIAKKMMAKKEAKKK